MEFLRIHIFHVTHQVVAGLLDYGYPIFWDAQFRVSCRSIFGDNLFRTHLREEKHFLNKGFARHQHCQTVDADADASFEAAFGPTYSSYNIGDCHFVVLDDVLYTGSSNYTAEITEAQMAWLEQDLNHVPKDKLIIIGVHIATSRRNRPTSHITNYRELYALLDGYNVRILSGH